jgi:hypothetical protein
MKGEMMENDRDLNLRRIADRCTPSAIADFTTR